MAAGHQITAQAAAEVLAEGGNAFDAVIAALWASCAAEPVLASPGGGGFLLARPLEGEPALYDFFVQTPRARSEKEDFAEVMVDFGVAQQAFHVGLGAAAVPGFVRGIFDVHRALGSMPMERLVEPAAAAARGGVELTAYQAYLLEVVGPIYDVTQSVRDLFRRTDLKGPSRLKGVGERFCLPELADAVEALAKEGDRLFYEGDLASAIVDQCQAGGHLTRLDLEAYRTVVRAPLTRRYRGATLLLNPPPSSGGLLIAFALEQLARRSLRGLSQGEPAHAAALINAMDAANRVRAEAMADGVARAALLSSELIERYASEVAQAPPSSRGTTHVSVIDGLGNAAAATVSNGEGCGHLVPGAGFMLNNMLGEDDLCAGEAGTWAPDQRMSSMMAPSVVISPDGALAVLGSGGSNRIRTAILQVLSNLIDLDLPPAEAVLAPRLHLEGDHLDFEPQLPVETARWLVEAFPDHTRWPDRNMFFGGVHTASRGAGGELEGEGDERRAGVSIRL